MEVIFEPAVLISLIGGLFIAMLSKRLTRLGEYVISHFSLLPVKSRRKIHILKWRHRKSLIITARSHHKVTWAIVRCYTLLILFILVITLYLLLITVGPLQGMGKLPGSVQAFISAPIYVFEILWILQKDKAQTLIKVAERRVTKPSN
jgi:hypothetical protein